MVGESDGEGSDGQVVTLGLETVLISDPGEGETVTFGGDPVRRSLVGVAHTGLVVLAVSVLAVAGAVAADLFLGVGFVAGGVVRSSVANGIGIQILSNPIENQGSIKLPPVAAAVQVADIRLADDGDGRGVIAGRVSSRGGVSGRV